jgi:hypothetical protein
MNNTGYGLFHQGILCLTIIFFTDVVGVTGLLVRIS